MGIKISPPYYKQFGLFFVFLQGEVHSSKKANNCSNKLHETHGKFVKHDIRSTGNSFRLNENAPANVYYKH